MPSFAVISFNAPAMAKACSRLSNAHGPAIKASGSALPKRALPMVTVEFGVICVLADDHGDPGRPGQPASFHRRKCRRPQERALDIGDDRAVLLAVVARLVPGRIGLESIPFFLAVGERIPG